MSRLTATDQSYEYRFTLHHFWREFGCGIAREDFNKIADVIATRVVETTPEAAFQCIGNRVAQRMWFQHAYDAHSGQFYPRRRRRRVAIPKETRRFLMQEYRRGVNVTPLCRILTDFHSWEDLWCFWLDHYTYQVAACVPDATADDFRLFTEGRIERMEYSRRVHRVVRRMWRGFFVQWAYIYCAGVGRLEELDQSVDSFLRKLLRVSVQRANRESEWDCLRREFGAADAVEGLIHEVKAEMVVLGSTGKTIIALENFPFSLKERVLKRLRVSGQEAEFNPSQGVDGRDMLLEEMVAGTALGPEQLCVLEDELRNARSLLSEDTWKTFELTGLFGFTYEEAAEQLGVSVNTIDKRLQRGRQKILKKFS